MSSGGRRVLTDARKIIEGEANRGSLINVIGIVADFGAPIPTAKEDYKATIRFYDESIEHTNELLSINIFREEKKMPKPSVGDVVLILQAKVQDYMSEWSLITNYATDIYIFTASEIPESPKSASVALDLSSVQKNAAALTKADLQHVSLFYHRIDKDRLPTVAEYVCKMTKSTNIKKKFCLLKEIRCDTFVDLVAEVVRRPYDAGDRINLWVSDYTEHQNLPNFPLTISAPDEKPGRKKKAQAAKENWTGPFGKQSIHISCFEPHIETIRSEKISVGSWVLIKNLQIKWGRNSSDLEGYLRTDGQKILISVLDPREDGETMDPRLKETIRRRRDYEKLRKKQFSDLKNAAKAGQKRRAALEDDESQPAKKGNAKAKRKEQRRAAQDLAASNSNAESEGPVPPKSTEATRPEIRLSSNIKCENGNQPVSTVAELLEQVHLETLVGKEAVKLLLPFNNANFLAHVRVKDYLPNKLEEFAVPKIQNELYDVLGDDPDEKSSDEDGSSSSDDDDSADEKAGKMDRFVTSEKINGWEWCFYLQLEDASADASADDKNTVWVQVDNFAGQCLLNMNAEDLRNSRELVAQLRQKLSHLWGNLEDVKRERLLRQEKAAEKARTNRPPPDSDDETTTNAKQQPQQQQQEKTPLNEAFACCIRQFGLKVRERDAAKADAGKGQRWQRMYGLFGTRIADG